jgi:pimeloyl-ACP methyl ester carboxylesterase
LTPESAERSLKRMPSGMRALALAAVATLAACARVRVDEQLLFMPRRAEAEERASGWRPAVEDFFFTAADGTRLNAWYLARPGAAATVLLFGGNAFALARSRGFVETITRHPVSLFMMDYRGSGKSQGSPTVATFLSDALAAYDVLRGRFEPDPRRIIVHGHSVGSFAATLVAAERSVGALVLENPATDARDTLRYLVPWYARPFVRLEVAPALLAESNLARIRRVRVPTLVAGGTRDTITSPRMARALCAASPAPSKRLVIVEGGGHNDLSSDTAFEAAYAEIVAAVSAGP